MLKLLQKEVQIWSEKNFGDQPSWIPLLGAVEELGELAHAHVKGAQRIKMEEDHVGNAKDAIGDIIIYLVDYCGRRGFNIEEIIRTTWEEVRRREWKKKS